MSVAIISGSAGLIGSEAAVFFAESKGLEVVGIDNDMRRKFFGDDASTAGSLARLQQRLGKKYSHNSTDIRDQSAIRKILQKYGREVSLVVHTAAQPSHDWAALDPSTDFTVNANGTAVMLEETWKAAPDAVFIFTSTNKVYGDTPNRLPLVEKEKRWEIDPGHAYADGIREDMSIDSTLHSLFGASKVAADILVQEYGRYFGMRTACFRGGCLTGPNHAGTALHGFLAYLMKCAVTGQPYTVHGYRGKQVRDNIHSADLIAAFDAFFSEPRNGEVYNVGGGRDSNCSMMEAIEQCEEIVGRPMSATYSDINRIGDHIWWISSLERFKSHYPAWKIRRDVPMILREIYEHNKERWQMESPAAIG
ncbi:MAG: nucleoside-diphosphate-sugar epimerase [Gemmatimonadales bacterium]|nr:nucleoside-diphosphate-sugar epimerase [Gemmatimonadales bacterium]